MQNNSPWAMQFFSPEQLTQLAEQAQNWTPEKRKQTELDSENLVEEIRTHLGQAPESPDLKPLAARWQALLTTFSGGDQAPQRCGKTTKNGKMFTSLCNRS